MGSGPKLFGLARVHCTLYIPCVLRVYPVLYFRRLRLTYQWCLAGFPAQDSYNLQLIMIFIEATPLGVVLLVSLRMLLIGPFLSSRRMATDSEMEGSEAILASVKALTDKFDTLQKEVRGGHPPSQAVAAAMRARMNLIETTEGGPTAPGPGAGAPGADPPGARAPGVDTPLGGNPGAL